MRLRLVLAVAAALGAAATAAAQPSGTYSKAVPPEKAVLDRLNLKTEWTQFLPVEGTRDALAQVQTLGDQVFVQTRTGLFVALDALTGKVQWTARLGNGGYANAYPAAANERLVFVAHVTKLFAFYRYSGVTEFVTDLETPVTAGLACDETAVFCVLGVRPGRAGAHRIAVFDLPPAVSVGEPPKPGKPDPLAAGARTGTTGPVDELLKRYSSGAITLAPDTFDQVVRPNALQAPGGGGLAGSKSPSLSALPSVVPPYSLDQRAPSPSLASASSLRQPYRIRSDASRFVQSTPSLNTIPPSVAAALALTDLRPKNVEPRLRWEYGLTSRVLYPVTLTPTRVWALTEDQRVVALNKYYDRAIVTEVVDTLPSPVPAAPVAAGTTHYVPFANGTLFAVEGGKGTVSGGVSVKWRADVAGLNNHSPLLTQKYVYASGEDTGVVCLDRELGDVVWRSETGADRIIGATDELAYVRDHQGRFLVFDARRPTDPVSKKSAPLGSAHFPEFNVNVVNTASDRVYLAADNGLIVCLRDAGAKYAKPLRTRPTADVNVPKKTGVDVLGGGSDADPKKEPEKK